MGGGCSNELLEKQSGRTGLVLFGRLPLTPLGDG